MSSVEGIKQWPKMDWEDMPVLLGTSDVAKIMGCSPVTIRRMYRNHELPVFQCHEIVRIPRDTLREYLEDKSRTNLAEQVTQGVSNQAPKPGRGPGRPSKTENA